MSLKEIVKKILNCKKEKKKNIKHDFENFSPIASENDIVASFRLLLNRYPSEQEWWGHKSTAGTPLVEIVNKFLSSAEFKKRNLLNSSLETTGHIMKEVDNYKIVVSQKDNICGQKLINNDIYEPHITTLLKLILKEGMTLLDIGANVGYFSLLGASLVGTKGKVIAVEPYSYNIKLLLLNKNINKFEQIEIIPFAATMQKGLLIYDDSAGNSGNILDMDTYDINEIFDTNIIYGVSLDEELSNYKEKIDVIKIDIEGAEYMAFKGMKNRLMADRPLIISELSGAFLQTISKVTMEEYLQLILIDETYKLGVIKKEKVEIMDNIEEVIDSCNKSPFGLIDVVAYPSDKFMFD